MHNVMQIATNAGHTAQNDGRTVQNDGRTVQNDSRNTLNVCQGPTLPTPILEKTLVSRNDF